MNKSQLYSYVKEKEPNICQIVVYKNNIEIYSDTWNNYNVNDCVHIMSATKSIMSILIGIAIDLGMVKSVNDKVISYFPEYNPKRGEKTIFDVSIRHLLTMRAPYKCKGDPWTRVCSSDDWTKTSLDLLGGRKGLTGEFNYQTVCLHVLSGILYAASGIKTVDFINKYLFKPLGIKKLKNYLALSAEEHKDFTINKLPKERVWFVDPQGIGTPGYGICLSANDMIKIGQLCLNHGNTSNSQVVSSDWISEMTTPTGFTGSKFQNMLYGYLWWILDEKNHIYAAIGNSGNVIYVNEKEKITVAITSYFKPTVFDRIDFIEKFLLKELL